ncbi:hypothetical protein F5Y18DRAFT_324629 [Xylariaceae sp. FL1019]|nr:hypothetical protein F5Y18DRAFT_324629 [Xylariaceae sp. FL1019]
MRDRLSDQHLHVLLQVTAWLLISCRYHLLFLVSLAKSTASDRQSELCLWICHSYTRADVHLTWCAYQSNTARDASTVLGIFRQKQMS